MFFRRLLVAGFLLIFTATAASAYTVVMRNGRRVEIPNTFTTTKSTLTYETAPGIQVTIQLTSIDVAATERANGLAAGTFLNLASKPTEPAPVQTQRRTASRSITNKDVEVYRNARIANERQREELGLPSVEERRREVEEIDDRTQQQIRDMRSREELEFWRSRATQLEAQMTATQNQISVMANQNNDYPWAYPYGVGLVTTGFPFGFVDGFHGFNKFGFNNFGFNRFGFNNFGFRSHFPGHFRGRLLFTTPSGPRGGFSTPMRGHGGGFRGGNGGGRGGRR
ncbi:MAG TPA: hypothetical protein VFM63_13025 [Pyrinomonadaceae bacterium]|nr:hypothetical protein [Pyrinomonadaceae bacterium]